jgi:phage recombination protein Bet
MKQELATAPKNSALSLMATRLNVDPTKLLDTLKNTVFKGATNDELLALVVVANQYGLSPFLKEIYAFPAKGGGIVPVVSVDGWIRMMNDHPQFDGIDYEWEREGGKLISCTSIIHRKDRAHPTRVTEYLSECKRNTDPWKMEHRMLRHKATIQGARVAFGFSGIVDEDEADRAHGARDVTPAKIPFIVTPPKLESGKEKEPREIKPNRTSWEKMKDSIEGNGIGWGQVAMAAVEGGIVMDADTPLIDQPEDVLLEIMAYWPQLVASVKGGVQ